MKIRKLELLSPAPNAEVAIQAILHGADAVYIGPPSHGARKSAANSIEDIERVVDFAHQYRAKVYATVNTIIYDSEIKQVEKLCKDLYQIGVDALIIQDLGILKMNLPPIALHASTQCDIRTPEKAKFFEALGFSQLVLPRELTLEEIHEISQAVSIPLESFVHGALCVSYSGRCHASLALTGRSANRGECAQICRYPFTLVDSEGKEICKNRYLLSLKDFNASHSLENLIEAGVSSFKIEGRLKDNNYVKNITAFYNCKLNEIISRHPDLYERSSYGDISLKFSPKPEKSFNRGFTDYFLTSRRPPKITSMLTPKSQGEPVKDVNMLNNGDGISFFTKDGEFTGVNINKVENGRIIPAKKIEIPKNSRIYRTSDIKWDKLLSGTTSERKIPVTITINDKDIVAEDIRGVKASVPLNLKYEEARQPQDYRKVFEKTGNTIYYLQNFESNISPLRFYRASELTELRRKLLEELDKNNKASYKFDRRKEEQKDFPYPEKELDYKDNVANSLAEQVYREHGVKNMERAAEVEGNLKSGDRLMTTRHCILRELGMCKKDSSNTPKLKYPLYLTYAGGKLKLDFNCQKCEMHVLKG